MSVSKFLNKIQKHSTRQTTSMYSRKDKYSNYLAQSAGVLPAQSFAMGSAPQATSNSACAGCPALHATCKHVLPFSCEIIS